jgi:hypothetical protein
VRRALALSIYVFAIAVGLVTIVRPLWVTTYPPMTDLPFHAAQTSIFRHYFDPSFHFQEQFEIAPLEVPYVSSYALGAFLMLFLPPVPAVKAATAIMLLCLPAGLATLSWGMRKSPLLGLLGAPFAWCHLTHWGFINFVSAIGMFAAAVGLAMRIVDRPSLRARVALGVVLVTIFFTHVFRFPFAIAGVLGAAAVMYPATRRFRPVLLPMAPSLVLFVLWWFLRPAAVDPTKGTLSFDLGRLSEAPGYLVNGFVDPAEAQTAKGWAEVVVIVALVCAGFAFVRFRERTRGERRFALLAPLVPLGCALAFTLMYLTLPMDLGDWWYVYPREATAAAFLLLALVPDLPEEAWLRGALVGALGLGSLSVGTYVADRYRAFDRSTADFAAVTAKIPQAPKLMYLVFDHGGSNRAQTPYIHLPAYVQAEKGGWLSFHFASFGASPIRYREGPDAVVPPPVPKRWEWTPERYDHATQGAFFDWFLVRSRESPTRLFRGDAIVLEAHQGSWWLFRRRR